jgi:hypothetical protein
MKPLTDVEIEKRLEQLTFTIALDTEHFHAFGDHKRRNIQKDLLMNKQALRALRHERDRRIIAGRYKPY